MLASISSGSCLAVAPLRYLTRVRPDFRTLAVLNQDYTWGRDSWAIWKGAMDAVKPGVRVLAELFPRFGATDFSTEITRLLALRPDVIFSTSCGGQGLEPMLIGVTKHVSEYPFPVIDRMVLFPPELTMNPIGTRGLDWARLLTPASVQRAPAEIPYRA